MRVSGSRAWVARYGVAAAFLLVPLLWGINWTFMKIGIQTIPPLLLLAMRQLLAGLAHAGLARASGSRFPRGVAMGQALFSGLLLAGISNGLMFWGVQFIPSGLASILFGTMPFFVAFLSAPVLGERLTAAKVAGVAVGFGGVAVLLGGEAGGASDLAAWGYAALMLSAVTWALPLVLIRKWLRTEDTIALTAVQMLSGAAFLLPLSLLTEGLSTLRWTPEGVISLAYMSIFSGFIAFALYYWLLRHLSATRVALLSFLTPVAAVITGTLVLGEPAEASLFVGLALVAAGITIVNQWGEGAQAAASAPQEAAAAVNCDSESGGEG